MFDTRNFALPMLAANQTQKHVTMNEALVRLDALSSPTVESLDVSTPPEDAPEGAAWIVAGSATGAWAGHENEIGFRVNGGWSFAVPRAGWRIWVGDRNAAYLFSGSAWVPEPVGPVIAGAFMSAGLVTGDTEIVSGAGFDTSIVIPDRAVVIGVTARVIAGISGAGLSGWRLGTPGATNRYGSSIGLALNSIANGVTGTPVAYYEPTPLRIEAEGGTFETGAVRLAIHYLALTPPEAV